MGNSKYKLLNKEFILSVAFVVIGTMAALSIFIFGANPLAVGVFCGFFPTGLGLLIIQLKTAESLEFQKKVQIKNEERNVFIRSKAGYGAFWAVYVVIFAAWFVSYFINIQLNYFAVALLIIMPTTYFALIVVYARRY